MAFLSTDDSLKYLGNECFLCNLNKYRMSHAYLTTYYTHVGMPDIKCLSSLKFKF